MHADINLFVKFPNIKGYGCWHVDNHAQREARILTVFCISVNNFENITYLNLKIF